MLFRCAGAITFLLLCPSAASAQTYIAANLGYVLPEDLKTSVGVRGRFDNGASATLAVGRSIGPFRGEVEGSYRFADVRDVQGFGLSARGSGGVSAYSGMANLYFDPAFSLGPFKPYIGGGAGASRFHADRISAIGLPAIAPVTSIGTVTGSKTGFAYQGMAGIGIKAGQGAFTLGYRYFATPSLTARVPLAGSVKVDGFKSHAIEVGFRIIL